MRAPASVLPLLCLLLLLAGPAAAEDEKNEIWTYTKGTETTELDVTAMSPSIRKALHAQLVENGWTRTAPTPKKPAPKKPTPKQADPEEKAPDIAESTRKDLEELIRRGGKLPEGFVPHGGRGPRGGPAVGGPGGGPTAAAMTPEVTAAFAKATGTLLLRYLDVKDDPAKGPVYEEILRDLANVLVKSGEDPTADLQAVGANMMGKVLGGMQDPKKAPVYREIMQIFGEAMGKAMGAATGLPGPGERGRGPFSSTPPPPPSPPAGAGPFEGAPREIGGALIAYMLSRQDDGELSMGAVVVRVPADSAAAQAGLAPGDRIERIDGKPTAAAGLERAHEAFSKGGKLTLRLRRKDGKVEELELDITLDDSEDGTPDKTPERDR